MLSQFILAAAALGLLLAVRVYQVLPRRNRPRRKDTDKRPSRSLAIFLGSGGHTAEMRAMLRALDRRKYAPRIYVYGAGDALSLRAVSELEEDTKSSEYSVLALPRARAVGEGKLSTLVSASRTLAVALWHSFLLPLIQRPSQPWADVLVLNGPGTAAVLVLVAYIRRVSWKAGTVLDKQLLGLRYTKIVYVESFARVKSLSLTGKLLRPLVDTFVVQWPDAAGDGAAPGSGTTYKGWLV